MTTVYARKEPTTDSFVEKENRSKPNHCDVRIYRDKEATDLMGIFPWHYSNKPTRRQRYVTLNCYRWKLEWLDSLEQK